MPTRGRGTRSSIALATAATDQHLARAHPPRSRSSAAPRARDRTPSCGARPRGLVRERARRRAAIRPRAPPVTPARGGPRVRPPEGALAARPAPQQLARRRGGLTAAAAAHPRRACETVNVTPSRVSPSRGERCLERVEARGVSRRATARGCHLALQCIHVSLAPEDDEVKPGTFARNVAATSALIQLVVHVVCVAASYLYHSKCVHTSHRCGRAPAPAHM